MRHYLVINEKYSRDPQIVTVEELNAQLKEWGDVETQLVERSGCLYDREIGDDYLIGVDIATEYAREMYGDMIDEATV